MSADCVLLTGKRHNVCQDYVRANDSYAFLADGCSRSPDSDVGARLLVFGAENHWLLLENTLGKAAIIDAKLIANSMHLQTRALDATLLAVRHSKITQSFLVDVYGDGIVAARRRDKRMVLHQYEYAKNAPRYLSYMLDPDRQIEYDKFEGNICTLSTVTLNLKGDIDDVQRLENPTGRLEFPESEYETVAILSDGAEQICRKADTGLMETLPWHVAAFKLANFVSKKGQFVQRQFNIFSDFCSQGNWRAIDDLSVAAVAID